MIYMWNNHGGELVFKNLDTLLKRGSYKGESGSKGVHMFLVDGIVYFTNDYI